MKMPKPPAVAVPPGFDATEWLPYYPAPWEDENGEWHPGGEPGFVLRFVRYDAFPDEPDGKTGATVAVTVTLRDIEASRDHVEELVANKIESATLALKCLYESKGVAFPE